MLLKLTEQSSGAPFILNSSSIYKIESLGEASRIYFTDDNDLDVGEDLTSIWNYLQKHQ